MRKMIVAWLIVLTMPTAALSLQLQVRFKPDVQVEGKMVNLGEIAELKPKSLAKKYVSQPLFKAPGPGQVKVLRADSLRAYILNYVSDKDINIKWSGAEKITLRRQGRVFGKEEIKELVNKYLQNSINSSRFDEISFYPSGRVEKFTLPPGELDCKVIPSQTELLKSRRFTLILRINDRLVKNMTVHGRIKAKASVVVAKKNLDRGAELTDSNLTIRSKDISGLDSPYFSIDKLLGKCAKHSLQSGAIIKRKDVTSPNLVRYGEVVTLVARKGKLLVTAKGIARDNGKKGEIVAVENTSSEKVIYGSVIGDGKVEVQF